MLLGLLVAGVVGYIFCLVTAHDRIDDQRKAVKLSREWKQGKNHRVRIFY